MQLLLSSSSLDMKDQNQTKKTFRGVIPHLQKNISNESEYRDQFKNQMLFSEGII